MPSPSAALPPRLSLEAPRFTLGPGQRATREVVVEGGTRTFLRVEVDQLGVDLTLRLLDENGADIVMIDSPIGSLGHEELVAILDGPGRFRVVVEANDPSVSADGRLVTFTTSDARDEDIRHVEADAAHRRAARCQEGEEEKALTLYRNALEVWRSLDLDLRVAETLDGMAQTYRRLHQHELAGTLLDEAIERASNLNRPHDIRRRASFRRNAGRLHRIELNASRDAVTRYFEPALAEAESIGDQRLTVLVSTSSSRARQDLGDFQGALDDTSRGLAVADLDAPSKEVFNLLLNRSTALLNLHAATEARVVAEHALAMARALDNDRYVTRARSRLATALARLDQLTEAEDHLNAVLPAMEAEGAAQLIQGLHALGDLQSRYGKQEAARATFERALALAQSIGDEDARATLQVEIGWLASQQGDATSSIALIDQALETYRRRGDLKGQAAALARGVEALRHLGRIDDAIARIAPALDLVDQLRAETARGDHRTEYYAARQEYYDLALRLHVARWQASQTDGLAHAALACHERRLARALREEITRPRTVSEAADERGLHDQLRVLATRTDLEPGARTTRINALLNTIHKQRAEHRAPPSAITTPPIELDSIRRMLGPTRLLLVWAVGEAESYVWALGKEGPLSLDVIPITGADLAERAAAWRQAIQSVRPADRRAGDTMARELGTLLLGPIADRLPPGQDLVIVPDGALASLPMGALRSPIGDIGDESDGSRTYLVETHSITILPSVGALAPLRAASDRRSSSPRPALVVSDPVYSRDDDRAPGATRGLRDGGPVAPVDAGAVARIQRRSGRGRLARLPATHEEALALLERMPVTESVHLTGLAANVDALRALPMARFGLVHFGSHAFADTANPELSGIVLSRVDARGDERAGFLHAVEVGALGLDAELVVLSGCETARGRVIRGEGMLGLARRFLERGTSRVVASLWQVSDRPTAELMTRFYDALLGDNLAPPEALRQAQRAMLTTPETADPVYWAGFTFQGDWRPVASWSPTWSRP